MCPNTAQTTQNSKIAAPTMNVGLRSSSRHGGSSPRPRATVTAAAGAATTSVIRRLPGGAAG